MVKNPGPEYMPSSGYEAAGPGFRLPPEEALELNRTNSGVLELWSNGKTLTGIFG
jgi:hypothetical protein